MHENRVLTKTGRPSAAMVTSWASTSPVIQATWGGKHRVMLPVGAAPGNDVVEAQKLILGRQHKRARVGSDAQPHAAREGALEHGEAAAGLEPDQEQLAGLVGGEGEARARAREPVGIMPRRGQRELLLGRRGGRRGRGIRGHRRVPLPLSRGREMLAAYVVAPHYTWTAPRATCAVQEGDDLFVESRPEWACHRLVAPISVNVPP